MKRVIIADDSSLARMFTTRTLSTAGYTGYSVIEAADGQEVFALINEEAPDLVITDLNMPEMDGVELMERIAGDSSLNNIPVIVITSAGNQTQRERLSELGALAILSKPTSAADLSSVIGSLLDKEDDEYGY